MKFQINCLQALERLIGGDSEVEMEIRKSTAVAFAKKHMLQLSDCPEVYEALNSAKTAVTKDVAERVAREIGQVRQVGSWPDRWEVTLKPEVVAKIQEEVTKRFSTVIDNAITKAVETWVGKSTMEERIAKIIEERLGIIVKRAVNKKIDEAPVSSTRIARLELD